MTIQMVDVEEILKTKPSRPLALVDLHALSDFREPYQALLLQPEGVIEASPNRVGFADQDFGHALCVCFLRIAVSKKSDIVITPEYCVPWMTIEGIVQDLYRPDPGSIWVLGCESISPAALQELTRRYNDVDGVFFYCELIDPRQAQQKRYIDPLLYVFWARDEQGKSILCLLVQMKTIACRDYFDIEQSALCVGQVIYRFNRGLGKIGLASIICSDALGFSSYIQALHENCLLIHIQLNPKPAHADYADYRQRLCSVGSNSHVELICLNWAENIQELQESGQCVGWNNVAGSAWYVPPAKFSADDTLIDQLHKKGLYYCLLKKRWHSFFLNFEGQILLLQKQKLMFSGDQAIAPKSCVSVIERWIWLTSNATWSPGAIANDGFTSVLTPYTAITTPLQQINANSPLAVERALEILVGPKGKPTSWFTVNELDAVHLDLEEESIRRVTVHQEKAPTKPGVIFRKLRLQRAHDAVSLPGKGVPWPASLSDLEKGFHLDWNYNNPHHNVVPSEKGRGTASLVYLADEADDASIDRVYKKLSQGLMDYAITQGGDIEKIGRYKDRLCIVYRRDNVLLTRGPDKVLINRPVEESPVDFAGDQE